MHGRRFISFEAIAAFKLSQISHWPAQYITGQRYRPRFGRRCYTIWRLFYMMIWLSFSPTRLARREADSPGNIFHAVKPGVSLSRRLYLQLYGVRPHFSSNGFLDTCKATAIASASPPGTLPGTTHTTIPPPLLYIARQARYYSRRRQSRCLRRREWFPRHTQEARFIHAAPPHHAGLHRGTAISFSLKPIFEILRPSLIG